MKLMFHVDGITNSGNNFKGLVEAEFDPIEAKVHGTKYDDWEMFKDHDPSFDDLVELETAINKKIAHITGVNPIA